jgi:two-component system OmpR family sensor kinase
VVGNLLGNVRVHTPADSPLVVEVTREPADTRTAGAAGGTGGAGGAGGAGGTGHGPAGTDGGDCPDGGTVVLRITDAGPGLALEDAARVFDRFFRAAPDRARGTGGAGLGMSIVQAVVQAHHGSVTLDTAPGRGVTVRVVLPAGGGEGGDSGDGDGGAGAGTTGGTGRGTAVSAAAPAATTT